MATLEVDGKRVEVKDGLNLMGPGAVLGIPFSCMNGTCGTCLSKVISGGENLSRLNDKEKAFGLDDEKRRLICQCNITKGKVVLKSGY